MSTSATMRLLKNELNGIEYKWGKIPLENVKSAVYSAFYDKIKGIACYHKNKKTSNSNNLEIQWYEEFIKVVKLLREEKDTNVCHELFKDFIENTTMKYLGLEALSGDFYGISINLLDYIENNFNIKNALILSKYEILEILEKNFKPMKKEPINVLVFSKEDTYLNSVTPNNNSNFNFRKYGLYMKRNPGFSIDDFEKIMPYDTKNTRVGLNFDMAIMNGINSSLFITSDPFNDKTEKILNYKNYFLYLFRHLRKDAPIIITLNARGLEKDTILFLSNYINNISMHYSKNGDIIIVYGTKKSIRTPNPKDFNDIISGLIVGEMKTPNEIVEFINNSDKEVLFECLYYDESTIINMLAESSSKVFTLEDKILEDIKIKKRETKISPPLPLNPGQIGLVLVSGHMDGLIDADGTTPHLISGNVFKKQDINVTEEDQNTVTKYTSYYSTLITVVDNKGNFKFIS